MTVPKDTAAFLSYGTVWNAVKALLSSAVDVTARVDIISEDIRRPEVGIPARVWIEESDPVPPGCLEPDIRRHVAKYPVGDRIVPLLKYPPEGSISIPMLASETKVSAGIPAPGPHSPSFPSVIRCLLSAHPYAKKSQYKPHACRYECSLPKAVDPAAYFILQVYLQTEVSVLYW